MGCDILITERAGSLRRVHNGALAGPPLDGVPSVHATDQEGLLDIALHPQFARNHLLYFTYSKEGRDGTTIALGRGRLEGDALLDVKDVFVADNWSKQNGNIGSRIVFLKDGTLLMTTGDRHLQKPAQDQTKHWGKILRLRDDGTGPADNPFAGNASFRPEIFSTGHRNPQGLAIDSASGAIYETEHGPQGGDELNLILPGMEQPLKYWVPSIAVGPRGLHGRSVSDVARQCVRRRDGRPRGGHAALSHRRVDETAARRRHAQAAAAAHTRRAAGPGRPDLPAHG